MDILLKYEDIMIPLLYQGWSYLGRLCALCLSENTIIHYYPRIWDIMVIQQYMLFRE